VRDRHSHESKGFGFVRMATQEGADAALQRLDNYLIGEAACAACVSGWSCKRGEGASCWEDCPCLQACIDLKG
jgi:hypothetical protein